MELPQPDSITVAPTSKTINAEGSTQFAATAHWPGGSTTNVSAEVTWTSSDSTVATVNTGRNTPGLVLAKKAGTATITATYPQYEFFIVG